MITLEANLKNEAQALLDWKSECNSDRPAPHCQQKRNVAGEKDCLLLSSAGLCSCLRGLQVVLMARKTVCWLRIDDVDHEE